MNLLFPRPQFVDNNGLPLASGTLETYASGTTTPKATYPTKTDLQAATNANNTTLTLNAAGRPTVDLWLNGSYKFILKDSSANTIYTVDNVNDPEYLRGADGNPILKVTGTTGAANYLQLTTATTGNPVLLATDGSDTNVGLTVSCKGSGTITLSNDVVYSGSVSFPGGISVGGDVTASGNVIATTGVLSGLGTSGSTGILKLSEQSTNGSNYIQIVPPSAVTTNATWTLPDGFGTTGYVKNTASGSNGTLSFVSGGLVIQSVSSTSSAVATGSTTIPYDDTIPQNTEGDQYFSLAITPTNSSNILEIMVVMNLYNSSASAGSMCVALFQDSTANALACRASNISQNVSTSHSVISLYYTMTAGTTSSTTFKVRAGHSQAGTTTLNGNGGNRKYGGVLYSGIWIREIQV